MYVCKFEFFHYCAPNVFYNTLRYFDTLVHKKYAFIIHITVVLPILSLKKVDARFQIYLLINVLNAKNTFLSFCKKQYLKFLLLDQLKI